MNNVDAEYSRLLNIVLSKGKIKKNRTGIDTIGVFGEQAKFDISLDAFPVLTTKKIFWRGIVHELLWFISGSINIKYLVDNDVHIWDEWAYAKYLKTPDKKPWDLNSDGTPFEQSLFIHLLKTCEGDNSGFAKWGELGEGTYGGMWRTFPVTHYYDQEQLVKYSKVGDTISSSDGERYVQFVDQLQKLVDKLKTNPDDRRLIVSAWHPYWVNHCALPPCHVMFHFNTEELTAQERFKMWLEVPNSNPYEVRPAIWDDEMVHQDADKVGIPRRKLNCLLYQRSCDTFLGVPFNISSYCLLTAMIAHVTNMVPGTFTHTYGDLHIYSNHLEQVKIQLSRDSYPLPKLWLNPEIKSLFDFKYEDIELENYQSHPTIKAEVAV